MEQALYMYYWWPHILIIDLIPLLHSQNNGISIKSVLWGVDVPQILIIDLIPSLHFSK